MSLEMKKMHPVFLSNCLVHFWMNMSDENGFLEGGWGWKVFDRKILDLLDVFIAYRHIMC